MLSNLFFLDGPHGSGKTTLGEELGKINPQVMIPELYSKNVKFKTEPKYRQALKICSRAIENFEYAQIAKKNLDKIILANRGIYGIFAYNLVYYKKGWIDKETYEKYNAHTSDFFQNENRNPYSIVLNPGFEVVKKHLKKRWEEKGKKWREEDLEYARIACKEYEKLKNNRLVYYIDSEINLETKKEIYECNEWMQEVSKIEQEKVLV